MNQDTIDFKLPAESPEESSREFHMSQELFQNARQTMGELRDWMRATGVSWDYLREISMEATASASPLDKALRRMDEYSTGPGRSLHDKPSNIR